MKKILLLLLLLPAFCFGQIEIKVFNAGWNSANGVAWVFDLKDCKAVGVTDIAKHPKIAKKYKIAVVPTIIIFKDGEEVARFQQILVLKWWQQKKKYKKKLVIKK